LYSPDADGIVNITHGEEKTSVIKCGGNATMDFTVYVLMEERGFSAHRLIETELLCPFGDQAVKLAF
jgi:hypothetical protein